MNADFRPDGRREARFALTGDLAVTITTDQFAIQTVPHTVQGRVVDLSEHGLRLEVDQEICLANTFRLSIHIVEIALHLHVSGRVCWSRQDNRGTWQLGCSLRPSIPSGLLDRLTETEQKNQRDSQRFGTNTEVLVQSDSHAHAELGRLRNYSRGGFCVATGQPRLPGEHLYIRVGEPETFSIAGTVQWQLESEKVFLTGCSFSDDSHFDQLHRLCKRRQVSEQLIETGI